MNGTAIYTKDEVNSIMELSYAYINLVWVTIGAIMIIFMQLGFAMLETGSVRMKNIQNVLLKNVIDTFTGAIAFYVSGYAFLNN
mmetsp:Transcript_8387/g.7771  ORF Transcript_8387/g.7771 Transcript_8387/m.7771 type:complete len:84 (+) Transcript_8387:2-253(+)